MFLSIITPTYNRAHTLHRVWQSLKCQEVMDFEWIVVDDGSTDNTRQLVLSWIKEGVFPIHYREVSHRGRNAAVNLGKTLASGKFVTVMDSDDAFLSCAMSEILAKIESNDGLEDPSISAIAFAYADEYGNDLSGKFPEKTFFGPFLGAVIRYRLGPEMLLVHKRKEFIRAEHLEIAPPDHVPESTTYARLNDSYGCLFFELTLGTKYRHDGEVRLTRGRNANVPKHPRGRYVKSREYLNHALIYAKYDYGLFLRLAKRMVCYGIYCRISLIDQYRSLSPAKAKLLWLVALPSGLLRASRFIAKYGRLKQKWDSEFSAKS